MRSSRHMNFLTLFAAALLLSGGAALAQSQERTESIASISADRMEVRWQPTVEYGHLILTVSSPAGEVYRKEFGAGATPSFRLTDSNGVKLPDGEYTYELRLVPHISREVREALAASRASGNSAELVQELQKSGQLPKSITVQSGAFQIREGLTLTGAPAEGAEPDSPGKPGRVQRQSKDEGEGTVRPQDVVTPDDIIVQGSACIGLDCVNNEPFGFDTIRLKENNTRILFMDTSVGTFPSNDWQLTANDSANGGANKFSIEDITGARVPFTLTAGAPTNSMFVASTGKVGFRTSTPVLDLHMNTSDTPAVRFEQNNTGGFSAQTWDVAGNEANFFVRDVTGGSRLPFRIVPGAPTNSIAIQSDGDVGVGTFTPSFKLQVDTDTPTGTGGNTIADGLTIRSNNGINGLQLMHGVSTGFVALNPDALGSGALGVGTKGNFPMHFYTNSGLTAGAPSTTGIRMTILGNGNVGVGTTNPLGKIDVNGTIFQRGVLLHADYVFEPTYSLESIEDHAAFMWDNKHLPAMGPRTTDEQGREVIEIGSRMRGMLEEIEKAHIYIEQLNGRIADKDQKLTSLERQNAELIERLARIETLLLVAKPEKK